MNPIKFKTVSYKAGTYIYVEEQTDYSEFYIVRQGTLIEENPLNVLTGEEDQIIKVGDFFGVLDCMSRRPRLSSIKVISDTVLIVIRSDQFESLITQMAPVAMKIIRYFSNKLRKYNTILSKYTANALSTSSRTVTNNFYTLGEYYQNQGQLNIAGYAYQKYLSHNPTGEYIQKATEALALINYNPSICEPQQQGIQKSYRAEVPIFLEHEEEPNLYILLEGFVKIVKFIDNTEVLLGMLKEKDIFGEMAILENSPRSASAITSTTATVLCINKENFELYIHSHPEIARRIIQLLSDRIWLVYKRLANQLINDPITKIYEGLQTLLQKNRIPIQKGLPYTFEMSPAEIIQFVGLDSKEGKRYMDQILSQDSSLFIEKNKLISRDIYGIRSAASRSNRQKLRKK